MTYNLYPTLHYLPDLHNDILNRKLYDKSIKEIYSSQTIDKLSWFSYHCSYLCKLLSSF